VRFLSACGDDGENEAVDLQSAVLYFGRYNVYVSGGHNTSIYPDVDSSFT
jgi:hypothetical protein